MRLIDADALKKKKKHSYKEFYENVVSVFDIDNAPTIEAIPVEWVQKRMPTIEPKHGQWIWRGGNLYECSECGAIVVAQDYIPIELHYFCRGCGADMRSTMSQVKPNNAVKEAKMDEVENG